MGNKSKIDVEVFIQKGIQDNINGGFRRPDFDHAWLRAKELPVGINPPASKADWDHADWNTDSGYFYYYRGLNADGKVVPPANPNGRPVRENGALHFPPGSESEFDVEAASGKIVHVFALHSIATATSGTPYYTVSGPTPSGKWTVSGTAHTDADTHEDHFYLWGTDGSAGATVILCDPIIRNRNQQGR